MTTDSAWSSKQKRAFVTTDRLGKAAIPGLPFENPDGSALKIGTDYKGKERNEQNPFPGPFEITAGGTLKFKVWPLT